MHMFISIFSRVVISCEIFLINEMMQIQCQYLFSCLGLFSDHKSAKNASCLEYIDKYDQKSISTFQNLSHISTHK